MICPNGGQCQHGCPVLAGSVVCMVDEFDNCPYNAGPCDEDCPAEVCRKYVREVARDN